MCARLGSLRAVARKLLLRLVMGWNDDGAFAGQSKQKVASMAHWCVTQARSDDCHWHAFDAALGRELIEAAAGESRTRGDPPTASPALEAKLRGLTAQLAAACERLRTLR